MSTLARGRRNVLTIAGAATAAATVLALGGCATGGGDSEAGGDVTIEFAQWWEPELPDGAFRGLIDQFEEENPGITVELISGPYASTKEQLFAGAASGTMPDVVGLDGAWVSDFASQGAIADLTALMAEEGIDDSKLASQIQVDGATYMIPVVNFVYPLFVNTDLLGQAGIAAIPSTRTEFTDAAKAITGLGAERLGAAALARSAQRHPERRHVVELGVRRLDARRRRQARPHQRRREEHGRVRAGPVRRRRCRPRRVHDEGAGQGRGVHQRPRRHDDRLALAHQPDPGEQPRAELRHRGDPGRRRLRRRAGHPVRLVGHRCR